MASPTVLKLAGCAKALVPVDSLDCTVRQLKEAIAVALGTKAAPPHRFNRHSSYLILDVTLSVPNEKSYAAMQVAAPTL